MPKQGLLYCQRLGFIAALHTEGGIRFCKALCNATTQAAIEKLMVLWCG